MATINQVKQAFLDAYGHFADQRIKKLESGNYFHVDDRGPGDYDAKKKLFLWFCVIGATVEAGDKVFVEISESMPKNAAVEKWWKENSVPGRYDRPRLELGPGDQGKLEELAHLIDGVIKAKYAVKAYKYVAPRTAASLRRLKKVLDKVWS